MLVIRDIISCRCPDFSEKDTQDWDARSDHGNTGFCDVPYDKIGGLTWMSVSILAGPEETTLPRE